MSKCLGHHQSSFSQTAKAVTALHEIKEEIARYIAGKEELKDKDM